MAKMLNGMQRVPTDEKRALSSGAQDIISQGVHGSGGFDSRFGQKGNTRWEAFGNNFKDWLQGLWDDFTGKSQNDDKIAWEKESQQSAQEHEDEQARLKRESDEKINEENLKFQRETNAQNYDVAMQNLQFQKDLQEYNAKLQEKLFEREDTSYERTVKDLARSGLSPLFMNGVNDSGAVVSQSPLGNDYEAVAPHLDQVGGVADTIMRGTPDLQNNALSAVSTIGNLFAQSMGAISEFGDRQDRKKASKLALDTAIKNKKWLEDNGFESEKQFEWEKDEKNRQHDIDMQREQINYETNKYLAELDFKGIQNDMDRTLQREKLSQEDKHFIESQKTEMAKLQQKYDEMSQKDKLTCQGFLNNLEIQLMKNNLSREQFMAEMDLKLEQYAHDKKIDNIQEVRSWLSMLVDGVETWANFKVGRLTRSSVRSRSDVNMNSNANVNVTSNSTADITHRRGRSRY